VKGFVEENWKRLDEGDQIGTQKIQCFDELKLRKIRLTITSKDGYPAIRKRGIYHAER